MVAEKFQIHAVTITGKSICESKSWICSFLLISLSKNLLHVLVITTPGRGKLTIFPKQRFLYFSSAEREEDYEAEEMTKIKHSRVLVKSFDKFHHLCNLYIFAFCFTVPQSRFKHAEVWGFLNLTSLIFIKKYSVLKKLHERWNLALFFNHFTQHKLN